MVCQNKYNSNIRCDELYVSIIDKITEKFEILMK